MVNRQDWVAIWHPTSRTKQTIFVLKKDYLIRVGTECRYGSWIQAEANGIK